MDLQASERIAVTWFAAMAALALVRPIGPARRRRVWRGAVLAVALVLGVSRLPDDGLGAAWGAMLPGLFVLAAYWISGAFYVAPQPRLERWLLDLDHRLFRRLRLGPSGRPSSWWASAAVEAAYLCVYPVLPVGALVAWRAGGPDAADWFWRVVFTAEAASYTALAWIQTRPPRVLEAPADTPSDTSGDAPAPRTMVHALNAVIVSRGSIQVNTLPSGHAAGAVAVALALASIVGWLAVPFAVVAIAIAVATVIGRYHYTIDTLAGAGVALAAWGLFRFLTGAIV